jgi:cysteine desulfurase
VTKTLESIYLDHAATTSLRPEAMRAMEEVYRRGDGNASGTHSQARQAKNALEAAREQAALLIGAQRPQNIVFTAGGTESDNLAVIGAALHSDNRKVVVSGIEHKAVLRAAASLERFGYSVDDIAPTAGCVVTPDAARRIISSDTAVVSIMTANNETGVIQPIAELVDVVRDVAPQAVFHTDAVQAFNAMDVSVSDTSVDLLSLSGHKFGGPTGVGLLFVATGVVLDPIIHGGGHEAGLRSGTSNVAGIVGMVAAMQATAADRDRFRTAAGAERDVFEATLSRRLRNIEVTAQTTPRMAHFSHVRFPGISSESLLIRLDQNKIAAAAGSACQSGAIDPSHVLKAMGMSEEAVAECVRFTFGWDTAPGDGRRFGEAVADVVELIR